MLKIDVCRNGLTDRWVDVQPIAKSRSSVAERDKIGKTSKMVFKKTNVLSKHRPTIAKFQQMYISASNEHLCFAAF